MPGSRKLCDLYSGPCDERPPLLRSLGGLSWGCGLRSGCKMYKKYYLVRTRGGHIRQVGLTTGGLLSQGPLYMYLPQIQFKLCEVVIPLSFIPNTTYIVLLTWIMSLWLAVLTWADGSGVYKQQIAHLICNSLSFFDRTCLFATFL